MIVARFTGRVLDTDEARAEACQYAGDQHAGWMVDLMSDLELAKIAHRDERRRNSINLWELSAVRGE